MASSHISIALFVLAEREAQHLRGVEHGVEVPLVESERLTVVLDGLLGLTGEGGDIAQQVVDLGRVGIDLERLLRCCLCPPDIAVLGQIPTLDRGGPREFIGST